ncbi:hypothetical protein GCM10011313_21820 [Mycetocola zhadangensis]|nr:hypothetical protein GCM10011313_21820 [Mycetocola zhadangensis]
MAGDAEYVSAIEPSDYGALLEDLKRRVHGARYQVQRKANTELLRLYWQIGQTLLQRREAEGWGSRGATNAAVRRRAVRRIGTMITIRPYRPDDRPDIVDVCVRTGRTGLDATGMYSSDDLLPDIYALPYVDSEPELAFVADNGERVVGYVIAAANTRDFASWFSNTWWPSVAGKYDHPTSDAEVHTLASAGDPHRMLIADVDDYPAHLHIDLLPEAQGQGLGRLLIDTLRVVLAERGIPGLHLTMGADNTNAGAFYRRLGFTELASSTPTATTFGMRIDKP